jgi:serine/threonine protein kinase
MIPVFTCPNGHRWEVPDHGDSTTTELPSRCPLCGSAAEAESPSPRSEAAEAITKPMPVGLAVPAMPGYELLEELGRGGMGVVYKARHAGLDRLVAVKVLPTESSPEPAFAERFAREARALARLNHPNIIAIYDYGQDGGRSYFIMEYVEGSNLRQRLHAGPVPPAEVLSITAQICDALQYAHDEGIIHRDIKPENILLDKRGRVKVADFGIAKLLTHRTAEFTLTGPWQVLGTLHYMAPEQIDNPQAIDHRADLYALGVLLYELLTGRRPVGHFPPPSQLVAVDSRVDDIILRALETDPARRYQKAAEMKTALECLTASPPAHPLTAPTNRLENGEGAVGGARGPSREGSTPLQGPATLEPALHSPGSPTARPYASVVAGVLRLGKSVAGWAMLLCILGLVLCFQPVSPWAVTDYWNPPELYGYETAAGIVVASLYLSILLFHIATGSPNPVPAWQALLFVLLGIGTFVLTSSCFIFHNVFFRYTSGQFRPMPPVFGCEAISLAILLLATVQLRQVRARRRQPAA